MSNKRILITGAGGYVGSMLGERLAKQHFVLGTDLRPRTDLGFEVLPLDTRDATLHRLLRERRITHVVHLAAVLEGAKSREIEYDIEVRGTQNVVDSCLSAGVRHLTVSSSGAAYGYFADNPEWIGEEQPLRAGYAFGYAYHKRLIEEMLAKYRRTHSQLGQLVLRICTVLGATTNNQITALFKRKRIIHVRGGDSRFVFVWDQDVIAAIEHGVSADRQGVYNLAGDGALSVHEIAGRLGKPVLSVPASALRPALALGRLLQVTRYGPEQVDFLRYRPVLSNALLKREFGFVPSKSSAEAFEMFAAAQGGTGRRTP